jgi:hypothetical protein
MKKATKLFVVLLSLVIIVLNTSCSNDNTKKYEKLIIGQWQVNNAHKQLNANSVLIWEFAPGGSFISYDDHIWSGAYVINNDKLSISFPSTNELWNYNIINLDNDYLELDEIYDDGTFSRCLLTRWSN